MVPFPSTAFQGLFTEEYRQRMRGRVIHAYFQHTAIKLEHQLNHLSTWTYGAGGTVATMLFV